MTGQIVYVAHLEDHEGCGTLELTVHATRAAADAAFLQMATEEFERYPNWDINDMTAEEVSDYLDEEFGKTGGVREEEVLP